MTGKYKIGDKVTPISKCGSWVSLIESSCWNEAKKMNQPFLYIKNIDDQGVHMCSEENTDPIRSDWFFEKDLIPYIEPKVIEKSKETTKSMKNKNRIKVKGPKSLILAFAEELNSIRYVKISRTLLSLNNEPEKIYENNCITTYSDAGYTILNTENIAKYGDGDEPIFTLPEDWNKALELAKEEIVQKEKFEVGDYVTLKSKDSYGDVKPGEVLRVDTMGAENWIGFNKYKAYGNSNNHHNPRGFRKATEQEYLQYHVDKSGLKIGDVISEDILNAWSSAGENYHMDSYNWRKTETGFIGDRDVKEFKIVKEKACMQISGTMSDVALSIEGIGEFIKEYHKEDLKFDTYLPEVKDDYTINYGCQKFTEQQLEAYIRLLKVPGISDITIHGRKLTEQILTSLIKKIENGK